MIYVTVNSTSINTKGLRIQLLRGSIPNTCSFRMENPTTAPSPGQAVTAYRDTTSNMIFTGMIVSILKSDIVPGRIYAYDVECMDYQKLLDRRLVAESYEDQTCGAIIEDIIDNYTTGFTYNNVSTGRVINKIVFNYLTVGKCIQELADLINFDWYVDVDKDIHFFAKETVFAPYEITDTTLRTMIKGWNITPDYSQIRNKIMVRGGYELSDPQTESIVADGSQRSWPLSAAPHSLSITVDTVSKTVGIENIDDESTKDYMMNYTEKFVRCSSGTDTPTAGTIMAFTYSYRIPVIAYAQNYASQAAMAAIEGGDGIIEHIVKDETLTSANEAHDRAEMEINTWGKPLVSGNFQTTDCHGWKPGQTLVVDRTGESLNGNYQVSGVLIKMKNGIVFYTINFHTVKDDLQSYLLRLADKLNRVVFRADETVDLFEMIAEEIIVSEGTWIIQLGAALQKWGTFKWGVGSWGAEA